MALWYIPHVWRPCSANLASLLVIISFYLFIVSAVYDSNHPYRRENFDPAEADPSGNITCLGDKYAIDLPVFGNFNPNLVTMQQLCAKPQYNGGLPGQHAGGWCRHDRIGRSNFERQLAFDQSPGARVNNRLQNPRILLGCILRCYCNSATTDPSVQPVIWSGQNTGGRSALTQYTYEINVDVVDDFDAINNQKMKEHTSLINAASIWQQSQVGVPDMRTTLVSINQQNAIQCRGRLPSFPLPLPFRTSQFRNNQELCSVHSFPNNYVANAGGYCHRTYLPTGQSSNTVWFSDEFTPRYDWTWNNFFVSASIRFHCWRNCACASDPTRDNTTSIPSTTKLWAFVNGHEMSLHNDGSNTYQQIGSQQSEGQVLPPQNRLGTPAGTCGADGKQFCNVPWPADVLGPIPQTPPLTSDVYGVLPGAGEGNLTVCGKTCNGPQDCRASDPDLDCFCALPSPNDAHLLGLDPVASPFVCLGLAASVIAGGLGKRDEKRYVDERGMEYRCPCNGTYVATECCGVEDGMVYLS